MTTIIFQIKTFWIYHLKLETRRTRELREAFRMHLAIKDWNQVLQLLITGKDVVILLWLAYWSQRFIRSYRRGENGVTLAMALFFTAMSIERLWLVVDALYHLFCAGIGLITLILLGWREVSAWFVIISMGLIMWRFSRDNKNDH